MSKRTSKLILRVSPLSIVYAETTDEVKPWAQYSPHRSAVYATKNPTVCILFMTKNETHQSTENNYLKWVSSTAFQKKWVGTEKQITVLCYWETYPRCPQKSHKQGMAKELAVGMAGMLWTHSNLSHHLTLGTSYWGEQLALRGKRMSSIVLTENKQCKIILLSLDNTITDTPRAYLV